MDEHNNSYYNLKRKDIETLHHANQSPATYLCQMHYASVENLTKSYGVRVLFKNISLNIEEGDKIALVARNGSGKSTLMKIIASLDTADDGTVWVNKEIQTVMLQQDNDFDPQKTIWDNILRLDNNVVKAVKEYEEFLENGIDDTNKLSSLMNRLEELDA